MFILKKVADLALNYMYLATSINLHTCVSTFRNFIHITLPHVHAVNNIKYTFGHTVLNIW